MLSLSYMVIRCVPTVVGCECWAFLTWLLDVFLPWSDVSVGHAFMTWLLDVFLPWSDVSVGRTFLTWLLDVFFPWSDISDEEDEELHGE